MKTPPHTPPVGNAPEGNAIVYCERAFLTPTGKTAQAIARRTARYRVLAIIDATQAGRDAGEALGEGPNGIPIVASLDEALEQTRDSKTPPTHFVVGLNPDEGKLSDPDRDAVLDALRKGLHVDSGLHDFLTDDPEIRELAALHGLTLRDARRTPPRKYLHSFSGKIAEVSSFRIALLGTDANVGKMATGWALVDALNAAGHVTELIGTSETSWMQGLSYGIILDSLIQDFVTGELEHAVWEAWHRRRPDILVIEGHGSLLHPASPGGLELLAATRPHAIVLQHSPHRRDYDGFPGRPIHPIATQIRALELLSDVPVVAVTLSHEGSRDKPRPADATDITTETGIRAIDLQTGGIAPLLDTLLPRIKTHRRSTENS